MMNLCLIPLFVDHVLGSVAESPTFEKLRLPLVVPSVEDSGHTKVKKIQPICVDTECNNDRRPPRKPDDPTRPLTETGGWGFSYGPLPKEHPGAFPNDSMMATWMRGQWGTDGRNDLGMIHKMGAKMVRLYGNDPRFDATEFLNVANSWGLKVITGISDYPYTDVDGACKTNGFDCYKHIKESYKMNLDSGKYLVMVDGMVDGRYHPALDTLIIVNEPDLKFVQTTGGPDPKYMKAILSAFDGILSAEEEMGVDVTLATNIKFSVAFSYSTCEKCPNVLKLRELGCCILCKHDDFQGAPNDCSDLGDVGKPHDEGGMRCPTNRQPFFKDDCPVLPQIVDLHTAMEDPSLVGYKFKTKGWELAYKNRWVHSFNGFVGADVMQQQFLNKYVDLPFNKGKEVSEMVPVFMGEYGDPNMARNPAKLEADIKKARSLVESKDNPFFGFNFFQFAVAYWKPCNEEKQWDEWQAQNWGEPLNGQPPGSCMERLFGTFSAGDILVSKTGYVPGKDSRWPYPIPCMKPIFKGKPDAVARAFGGEPPDTSVCEAGWAADPTQYCVAARGDLGKLGKAIEYVCGSGLEGDCQEGMPEVCKEDEYSKGDFILSKFFEAKKATQGAKPNEICDFDGAGVVTAIPSRPECVLTTVLTTETTTTTQPGGGGAVTDTTTTANGDEEEKPSNTWKIVVTCIIAFIVVGVLVAKFVLGRQAEPELLEGQGNQGQTLEMQDASFRDARS